MRKRRGHRGESGQALVEAALTMPMAIFLILGTVQLFLMLQARIMAEYAVVQAVRQGSVRHGACEPMVHTAVSLVLPTFRKTNDADSLGKAFKNVFKGGSAKNDAVGAKFKFDPGWDFGHDREVVWLYRRSPLRERIRDGEEELFDDLSLAAPRRVLQAELVYWFPLKIPFANWVIARMALAEAGLRSYTAANPLMFTRKNANWKGDGDAAISDGAQKTEWRRRIKAEQYTVPIIVNAAMPMMSPPRRSEFNSQHCFKPKP